MLDRRFRLAFESLLVVGDRNNGVLSTGLSNPEVRMVSRDGSRVR